jgi:hypothetical protein
MAKSLFPTTAVFAVVALNSVDAHSKMTKPNPNSPINNSPSGTLDGPNTLQVPAGMHFDYGYEENTAAFLKAYHSQTKYTSIRQMVYDKFRSAGNSTKECGQSAMTGPPQDLPVMVEYETGFDSTHWGLAKSGATISVCSTRTTARSSIRRSQVSCLTTRLSALVPSDSSLSGSRFTCQTGRRIFRARRSPANKPARL